MREIFTTPGLVTPQRSILGLPAEGRPGPSDLHLSTTTTKYLFDPHDVYNPHILWPGFASTPAAVLGSFAIGVITTAATGTST